MMKLSSTHQDWIQRASILILIALIVVMAYWIV